MATAIDLKRIPLFAELNEAALARLERGVEVRRLEPGQHLWKRGEPARGLHVVVEGEVRVTREGKGRRRVLHTEGPGGTLGEVPLFESGLYPATAVATRRSVCVSFARAVIVDAIRADPALALGLLRGLAGRVHQLIDRIERFAARSVSARLAAHIRTRAASAVVFTLGGTQQQIAEELGTVREVIVRELRALREAGVIESAGRGRYRVVDPAALERLEL